MLCSSPNQMSNIMNIVLIFCKSIKESIMDQVPYRQIRIKIIEATESFNGFLSTNITGIECSLLIVLCFLIDVIVPQ